MIPSRVFVLRVALSLTLSVVFRLEPSTAAHQSADPVPVAIRFQQVLVDTVIEPVDIVDGVPEAPTGLWSVGRYDSSPLNTPGGQFFYGFSEYWGSPGVFRYLNQSQPGQPVIVTGSDGLNYVYKVESIELFSMQASVVDVFAAPIGAEYWLLLMSNATFDPALGPFSGIIVVRAIRSSDDVTAAPIAASQPSTGQETCPELDLLPPQSLYPDTASLGLPEAAETPVRTTDELEQILVDMPTCDFFVKEAMTLPDGNVLTLVGPEGQVPVEAVTGAVDATNGAVLDAQRATLYRYVLFVQVGDTWNASLPPG